MSASKTAENKSTPTMLKNIYVQDTLITNESSPFNYQLKINTKDTKKFKNKIRDFWTVKVKKSADTYIYYYEN